MPTLTLCKTAVPPKIVQQVKNDEADSYLLKAVCFSEGENL